MADLFVLTTAGARLTWSAPPTAADLGAAVTVRSLVGAPLSVHADGHTATGLTVTVPGGLAEETVYPVLLQSLCGEAVALVHADPVVTAGLTVSDAGRAVHGRIRTGAHAGRTVFVVAVGGAPVAEITLAVAPTKASWAHVEQMRAEVEAAGAGLSLTAVRPATGAATSADAPRSAVGWLVAAEASVADLERALARIERRPVAETARAVVPVRRSAVGRSASPETRRALARAARPAAFVPARPAVPTLDTPAHRWLRAAIEHAARQAAWLSREEARHAPTLRREATRARLDALAHRLARLASAPVLREADVSRAPAVPPLTLRRPVYVAAAEALGCLRAGLALRGGALDVAWQDLAVLYETWAALTVVRVAAEAVGVSVPVRPFGLGAVGTRVLLRSGRRHRVRLDGLRGRVEIVRGPLFAGPAGRPPLLRQRPDLYLVVTPAGRAPQRVVLDAKYRVDRRPATVRRYGTPAPPADALGALHRYRDAIRGPEGTSGWIAEAIALFPSDDEAWASGRLWTHIETGGVGAVGLLPGHDAPLRALFDRWLG